MSSSEIPQFPKTYWREIELPFENISKNQRLQTKASAKFTDPDSEHYIFLFLIACYCLVKKPLGVAVWSNSYW